MCVFYPSITTLIILSTATIFADDEYTPEQIDGKIKDYTRMKGAGNGLLAGGIVLDVVGVISLISGISSLVEESNNTDYYESNYSSSSSTPDGFVGLVIGEYCLIFGIPMTVAGSVLSAIGKHKRSEYQNRLGLKITPNSLSMVYRF